MVDAMEEEVVEEPSGQEMTMEEQTVEETVKPLSYYNKFKKIFI